MNSESQTNESSPSWMQRFTWPVVVVGLLLGHVLLMMVALVASSSLPAAVTTPSAYADGITWDDQQAKRRASAALQWSLQVEGGKQASLTSERELTFRLTDAQDQPIEEASLYLEIFHHSRPTDVIKKHLSPKAPGVYTAVLKIRRNGLWRIHAQATKGDEAFIVDRDYWIDDLGVRPGVSN